MRDLLMHTSGLVGRDTETPVGELYRRAGFKGSQSAGTLEEMIQKLSRIPLQCDPGSTWIYGWSTDLVGYICQVLTGLSFDRYLEERIFRPLGMVDTGFTVPPDKLDRFAANYAPADGTPRYTLLDDPYTSPYARPRTYFSGAGGLVSTAADYLKFCRMLANGGDLDGVRILGPRTVELMSINHLPDNRDIASMAFVVDKTDEGHGFGLGFGVLLDPARAQQIGTPGEYYWAGAASTEFFINPREQLIAIFLTQLQPIMTYPLGRQLRATVYSALID
jgi:CubicO group peptidase (beta-lactamase class C family)